MKPFFALVFVDDNDNKFGFGAGGRFTIGALDGLEVGVNLGFLSIDTIDVIGPETIFGNIEAGLKYRFIDEGGKFPFSLAYQGGITVPTGSSDEQWVFVNLLV